MRVKGTARVYAVDSDRLLTLPELRAAVRLGRARIVMQKSNLVTDAGLDALTGLVAGAVGIPAPGGIGIGPEHPEDLFVDCMRVTGHPAPPQPTGADDRLAGGLYIDGWPTNAPAPDSDVPDDNGLPAWSGHFPYSRAEDTSWYTRGGFRMGGTNDDVLEAARIDTVSSGKRLTILGRRSAGLAKIVWQGIKTGTGFAGVYTRTGGSSNTPATYTVQEHPVRTWRGYDFTVEYPSTGAVRFSGFIPVNEDNGLTYYEQGLYTQNQTLFARALLGSPATGTITFPGALIVDEDEVTIDDGFTAITFEFDTDGSVAGGNVAVPVTPNDNAATMASLVNAINESGLLVRAFRATVTPPVAQIRHTVVGLVGNETITTNSASIVPVGMSGGYLGVTKTGASALQFTHTLRFIP